MSLQICQRFGYTYSNGSVHMAAINASYEFAWNKANLVPTQLLDSSARLVASIGCDGTETPLFCGLYSFLLPSHCIALVRLAFCVTRRVHTNTPFLLNLFVFSTL